jgi:2'-5' RNA ligase
MKFWVGILIPKKEYRKIRDVQEKLSKKYDTFRCMESNFGPHITLTYQPKVDYRYIRKMEKDVLEIFKGTKPFNLRFGGFGKLDKNRVICAMVLKDSEIITLNKKLSSRLKKYGKVMHRQFKPHVALAIFENSGKIFREAFKETESKKMSFSFRLEGLSIAKGNANGRMKIYKTLTLSG